MSYSDQHSAEWRSWSACWCVLVSCLQQNCTSHAQWVNALGGHCFYLCVPVLVSSSVRNVGARFSHSLTKSSQLKQVSVPLPFLRRIEGALMLTRLVHSLLTLFATCCNISLENTGCFSTALQKDLYHFREMLFPIGSRSSSRVTDIGLEYPRDIYFGKKM